MMQRTRKRMKAIIDFPPPHSPRQPITKIRGSRSAAQSRMTASSSRCFWESSGTTRMPSAGSRRDGESLSSATDLRLPEVDLGMERAQIEHRARVAGGAAEQLL